MFFIIVQLYRSSVTFRRGNNLFFEMWPNKAHESGRQSLKCSVLQLKCFSSVLVVTRSSVLLASQILYLCLSLQLFVRFQLSAWLEFSSKRLFNLKNCMYEISVSFAFSLCSLIIAKCIHGCWIRVIFVVWGGETVLFVVYLNIFLSFQNSVSQKV